MLSIAHLQHVRSVGNGAEIDRSQDFIGLSSDTFGACREEAEAINAELGLPAVCGEWSLGLDLKVVSLWAEGPFNHALEHMDRFQQDVACRAYGDSQLMTFERLAGWFFWSYRTETAPAWCLRECVERGWLPSRFG